MEFFVTVAMSDRFFAEVVRLTKVSDDDKLLAEFYDVPNSISITASENNAPIVNLAKVIKMNEAIDEKFISGVYVNGSMVDYQIKNDLILIPADKFTQAGDYAINITLISNAESNVINMTLTEPTHIDYKLSMGQLSDVVNAGARAGANHSRYGETPTKLTWDEINALEGSLDDQVWVKWDIEV